MRFNLRSSEISVRANSACTKSKVSAAPRFGMMPKKRKGNKIGLSGIVYGRNVKSEAHLTVRQLAQPIGGCPMGV